MLVRSSFLGSYHAGAGYRATVWSGVLARRYLYAEIFLCERDEVLHLCVVHEAAVILVGLAQSVAGPDGVEPAATAAEGLPELVPADLTVSVGVQLLDELLQSHVVAGGVDAPEHHGWLVLAKAQYL